MLFQDSFDDAIIPLSTDYDLQDKYVTHLGYIRLGRIMEDMDFFAGFNTIHLICFLFPKLFDIK